MAKRKQKAFLYTPPTKREIPELYIIKAKMTTRGTKFTRVKQSWSPTKAKSASVSSSPTKSPLKKKSTSSGMLHQGGDFDFDQGDLRQPRFPKSLVCRNSSSVLTSGFDRLPQGQNDYLRQWKSKFNAYMDLLMAREAPPQDRLCSVCKKDGVYKCHGCFEEPLFCTDCCRSQHQRHPFHRISQWTGSCFQDTSLTKVGLQIHLGHGSMPCPCSADYHSDFFEWSDTEDIVDNADYPDGASIPLLMHSDSLHPPITVIDKSGVHSLSIWYCQCPGALQKDMQLFQAGLFPASFNKPKTAFTFSVLDDFLLDNLECGTSAMNYYSKLRRLTSSIFPLMVPVGHDLSPAITCNDNTYRIGTESS